MRSILVHFKEIFVNLFAPLKIDRRQQKRKQSFRSLYGVLAILLTLFLLGCKATTCVPFADKLDEEELFFSDARREITRIITIYSIELKQQLCLQLENAYVMHDDFGFHVWVDWKSQENLDIEEGRRYFVSIVEGLLDRLNYDDNLKSMTGNFQFSPDFLYLSIEFESFFGKYIDPLYIGRLELVDGIFGAFYAHDGFDVKSPVYHKHFEPYETSVLIVQTQRAMWEMQKEIEDSELKLEKEKAEYVRLLRQAFERKLRVKYKINENPPIPSVNRLQQSAPYLPQRMYPIVPVVPGQPYLPPAGYPANVPPGYPAVVPSAYPAAAPFAYPNTPLINPLAPNAPSAAYPYGPQSTTYPTYAPQTNAPVQQQPYPSPTQTYFANPNGIPQVYTPSPNGASPAYRPSNNPYPQQGQDFYPAPQQPSSNPNYYPSVTVPLLQPLNPI